MRIALAALGFVVFLSQSEFAPAQTAGPINLDFEQGAPNSLPQGWGLRGSNHFHAIASASAAHSGSLGVAITSDGANNANEAGILDQGTDATPFRGRRIRIGGFTRLSADATAGGRLWVRVDGPQGELLYFDNMMSRPVHATDWTHIDLYGRVPDSAVAIHFGYLMFGPGTAMADDFAIADAGAFGAGDEPARRLSEQGLANLTAFASLFGYVRYFHPSDEATNADWDVIARTGVQQVEDCASPSALRNKLQAIFAPVAPTMRVQVSAEAPPVYDLNTGDIVAWRRAGPPSTRPASDESGYVASRESPPAGLPMASRVVLPRGLVAYVPLRARRDASGHTAPAASARALPLREEPDGWQPSGEDRATRLASVVEAWNLLQHFFPYFDVVHTDWNAQLPIALQGAASDRDADAFKITMRRLMASLHDAHGYAADGAGPNLVLPFEWDWVENALVVTETGAGLSAVHRGDIVEAIDGRSIADLLQETEPLVSAPSATTRRYWALSRIAGGLLRNVVLTLRRADGLHQERVSAIRSFTSHRPTVSDAGRGIVYVDLTRFTDQDLSTNMQRLVEARGIVFDLRGYPTPSAVAVLQHLVTDHVHSDLFQVPTYHLPNRAGVSYDDAQWNDAALQPHFGQPVAFMTNGRAVSYAESVMGAVENDRLGAIVGAPTAGTNGDMAEARLASGMQIGFTGLVTRRPDGLIRHGVGIRPTIPVRPTIAGIRAGRDEVLEAAVAAVERTAAAARRPRGARLRQRRDNDGH